MNLDILSPITSITNFTENWLEQGFKYKINFNYYYLYISLRLPPVNLLLFKHLRIKFLISYRRLKVSSLVYKKFLHVF